MANHRGSIFGGVGLGAGHNQKHFDSLLFKQLQNLQGTCYFLMEAESKRIGKVTQPDELMSKKMNGINIHIHTPIEQRVAHIAQEYIDPYLNKAWYFDVINEALDRVMLRIKDDDLKDVLTGLLKNHQYNDMIQILLENYYDPKYDYKRRNTQENFLILMRIILKMQLIKLQTN